MAEVLVALRKQVQAGQRVTVLGRVEDQARRASAFARQRSRQPLAWTRWRCSSFGEAPSATAGRVSTARRLYESHNSVAGGDGLGVVGATLAIARKPN
jgi:hypothetical protein